MPNPPFSGSGNDLVLPIDPTTYVTDIEGNFGKLKQEIIDLHNRAAPSSAGGIFGTGQLELNGNFQITRWLDQKAVNFPAPGPSNIRVATPNYANLPTGAALGHAGTTHTYHPTRMAGWFIAQDMLSTGFGVEDVLDGNRYLKLGFAALTRVNNIANEDWPALYQPVSVHAPRDRWAGKSITISIKYNSNIANFGKLYAVWGGGTNGRVELLDTQILNAGTDVIAQLTLIPDVDATFLEFGILFTTPSAFDLTIKSFYMSDDSRRADPLKPEFAQEVVDLISRYYVQTWEFEQGQFVLDLLGGSSSYSSNYTFPVCAGHIAMPQGVPFQDPVAISDRHPGGSLYAEEYILESLASASGIGGMPQWDSVTDSVVIIVKHDEREAITGAPSIGIDGRNNVGLFRSGIQYFYVPNAAIQDRGIAPTVPIQGWGEVLANYTPIF